MASTNSSNKFMFINSFKRVLQTKFNLTMNLRKKCNNKKQDGRKIASKYFASTSTENETSKGNDSYLSDTSESISLKRSLISDQKIIKKTKQEPEDHLENVSSSSKLTKSNKNIKNNFVKKASKKRAKNSKKDLNKEKSFESNNQSDEQLELFKNTFIYKGHEFKLKWAPQNFQETWDNIEKMRLELSAPVDTMGCSHCHDDQADLKIQRFHSLVALMLSSQTKDEINYAAMNRLKEYGLTVQNILDIAESELAQIIRPVSFHNTKAKNLKKVAFILREQYHDDIPKTAEELCDLPGVGPKMAHLTMYCAWKKITGILVK